LRVLRLEIRKKLCEVEVCKRLREFEEIEISRQSCRAAVSVAVASVAAVSVAAVSVAAVSVAALSGIYLAAVSVTAYL
jgi:hypothetical protein